MKLVMEENNFLNEEKMGWNFKNFNCSETYFNPLGLTVGIFANWWTIRYKKGINEQVVKVLKSILPSNASIEIGIDTVTTCIFLSWMPYKIKQINEKVIYKPMNNINMQLDNINLNFNIAKMKAFMLLIIPVSWDLRVSKEKANRWKIR